METKIETSLFIFTSKHVSLCNFTGFTFVSPLDHLAVYMFGKRVAAPLHYVI